jgi:hypothetical protein
MAKRIYGKTVRELFDDFIAESNLTPGAIIERGQIIDWLVPDITLLEYQLKVTLGKVPGIPK